MIDSPVPEVAADNPALAFEALRGEVSLLRRAVEGLASARDKVPDYSPTLVEMVDALNAATGALKRIERSPAVHLTPAALTAEIDKAAAPARDADRTAARETHAALWKAIGRIDGIVERGQAADQQLRWLIWSGAGGALVGTLLMAVLPGAIARFASRKLACTGMDGGAGDADGTAGGGQAAGRDGAQGTTGARLLSWTPRN